MRPLQYAVVAYVRNPVGRFVEALRREVYPEHGHLPAHLTLLPPRCLNGSEEAALETLGQICATVEPFEVSLSEVESFIPVTPTVFIRVEESVKLRQLHDRRQRQQGQRHQNQQREEGIVLPRVAALAAVGILLQQFHVPAVGLPGHIE
ncbi:MAG: 2'-5' RNA ligase family protein, partial [Acidobacteria bacterium]|nr:2'-5' RNA ligase family protein [Acidobacteriota bacterium]